MFYSYLCSFKSHVGGHNLILPCSWQQVLKYLLHTPKYYQKRLIFGLSKILGQSKQVGRYLIKSIQYCRQGRSHPTVLESNTFANCSTRSMGCMYIEQYNLINLFVFRAQVPHVLAWYQSIWMKFWTVRTSYMSHPVWEEISLMMWTQQLTTPSKFFFSNLNTLLSAYKYFTFFEDKIRTFHTEPLFYLCGQ